MGIDGIGQQFRHGLPRGGRCHKAGITSRKPFRPNDGAEIVRQTRIRLAERRPGLAIRVPEQMEQEQRERRLSGAVRAGQRKGPVVASAAQAVSETRKGLPDGGRDDIAFQTMIGLPVPDEIHRAEEAAGNGGGLFHRRSSSS